MKRMIAVLLCVVLMVPLFGCSTDEFVYVPTGDALVIDGESVPPTEDPNAKEQYLELAYYPNYSLNPYNATNYVNRDRNMRLCIRIKRWWIGWIL